MGIRLEISQFCLVLGIGITKRKRKSSDALQMIVEDAKQ